MTTHMQTHMTTAFPRVLEQFIHNEYIIYISLLFNDVRIVPELEEKQLSYGLSYELSYGCHMVVIWLSYGSDARLAAWLCTWPKRWR